MSGGASGRVGGDASLLVGGDVTVDSSGSGSATFGDGVSLSGGSVVVESGEALVGVGRSVDVTGTEGVRVGSTGATVELSGVGDVEYVGFVWRSSASFDEFTNAVPSMTDVEEVLIRSSSSRRGASLGGARVVSAAGTSVSLWLASAEASWEGVWSSSLGAGSYSMDGLHVSFARQTVVGIRLSSRPSDRARAAA